VAGEKIRGKVEMLSLGAVKGTLLKSSLFTALIGRIRCYHADTRRQQPGWVSGIPNVVKQSCGSGPDAVSQSHGLVTDAILMLNIGSASVGEKRRPRDLPSLHTLEDAVLMQPVKHRQDGL
jgi:hypothetical protein